MATVKLLSLAVRTVAKPLSALIKTRAKTNETFRDGTIWIAQLLHRTEMQMRTKLLGQESKHIRPLNDAKAIESGANFVAESFLFLVAGAIIVAETKRQSNNKKNALEDRLDLLEAGILELNQQIAKIAEAAHLPVKESYTVTAIQQMHASDETSVASSQSSQPQHRQEKAAEDKQANLKAFRRAMTRLKQKQEGIANSALDSGH